MGVVYFSNHAGCEQRSVAAFCRNCSMSIGFIARQKPQPILNTPDFYRVFQTDGSINGMFIMVDYWPKPDIEGAPDYTSPNVSRIFQQAEANKAQKNWDAAGIMYRKVLETATKELGADLKNEGNLMKRIDLLAANGRLTKDLADWAHQVRIIGNETAHDECEPEAKDVLDLANLTRMLLVYLFELPGRVAAMRGQEEQAALPAPAPNTAG